VSGTQLRDGGVRRDRGLLAVTDALEKGDAEALVVAKLDRLSRSMTDFTRLMERSSKKGWARLTSAWDALAVKRAQGAQLGRPPVMPAKVVKRIEAMRDRGVSIRGIAEALNEAGVPTAHGGARWHASEHGAEGLGVADDRLTGSNDVIASADRAIGARSRQ
jgi:hypothetical protein